MRRGAEESLSHGLPSASLGVDQAASGDIVSKITERILGNTGPRAGGCLAGLR